MTDIVTVFKKELKELLKVYGSLQSWAFEVGFLVGVFGVFFSIQGMGLTGLILASIFVPSFISGRASADSFAGEVERKTLETLLSTRLSDRAILLGKITATTGYVWVLSLAAQAAAVLTALYAAKPDSQQIPLQAVAVAAVGSGLVSLFFVTMGSLISLRAGNVRAATQMASLPIFILGFVVLVFQRYYPFIAVTGFGRSISNTNPVLLTAAGLLLLLAFDALFVFLSLRQFRRSKLMDSR